jgi:transcriptional regulator with XRE-family HTH domain
MTVGERIHELRLERGLSQRELASPKDRVTYAYVSRIEANKRNPSIRALIILARRLRTTAYYLMTGRDYGVCPVCGNWFEGREHEV